MTLERIVLILSLLAALYTNSFRFTNRPFRLRSTSLHTNSKFKADEGGSKNLLTGILKNSNKKSKTSKDNAGIMNLLTEMLKNIDLDDLDMEDLMQEGDYDDDEGDDDDDDDNKVRRFREQSQLLDSVIRIYCTHSKPNFAMPWQRRRQESSTSTGFAIRDQRILTNAHSVEYGSLVQVKKRQSEDKFLAKVTAVSHECDLAVLEVEDQDFWKDIPTTSFGSLPDLQDDVSVIGYPIGGDSISITSGVVSRVEMQEYVQAAAQMLAIQIDAAINPGNSGGPVVNSKNEVIGVAFQSLDGDDTENIGYVVPVDVIEHFLEDVERNGYFTGVCATGLRFQSMESEALRRYFGMEPKETGLLINDVNPLAPAFNKLFPNDVLLTVDGVRVANDATIPFHENRLKDRVHLSHYFTQKFIGDVVTFDILRNKTRLEVIVPLWVPTSLVPRVLLKKNHLFIYNNTKLREPLPSDIVGGLPSYIIIGGMVFISLSKEYLQEFYIPDSDDMSLSAYGGTFRALSLMDKPQSYAHEEVVFLSQILSHACNIGYSSETNKRLMKFNGILIQNLFHFKTIFNDLKNEIQTKSCDFIFQFDDDSIIVIDGHLAVQSGEQICQENSIPSLYSIDLL